MASRYRLRSTFIAVLIAEVVIFFSSRRGHTRWPRDWSSDVCSSDLGHIGSERVTERDGLIGPGHSHGLAPGGEQGLLDPAGVVLLGLLSSRARFRVEHGVRELKERRCGVNIEPELSVLPDPESLLPQPKTEDDRIHDELARSVGPLAGSGDLLGYRELFIPSP